MHLAQYFVQAVKRFPEATAVVDDQVRWSYRDLYEEVETVATNIQQSGVKQGDHVLVVLRNHRENLVIYWTCQLLGLIYTPVNFRMPPGDLAYCIRNSDPRLILYEEGNRATVETALKQAQNSARSFAVGAGTGSGTFAELCRRGGTLQAVPSIGDDAIAIMLYTSGTTGTAKGAELLREELGDLLLQVLDAAEKLQYDLYYIKHLSVSLNAYIFLHSLKRKLAGVV